MPAKVAITGDNAGLRNSVKESESMLLGFGKTAVAVGAAIVGALAIRSAFNFGSSLVEAAMRSEEAETILGAALKATGNAAGFQKEQLIALADQLQSVTKYESEATQGAAAILATFRNIRGDVFIDAVKGTQDLAAVFGGDLNGKALQLGKALNDPLEGMNALSRSGISFSNFQKTMIKELIELGDVAGAQKIILDELKKEVGGAAEAIGKTAAGQFAILKNKLGDTAENLGFAIMKVINALEPAIEMGINFLTNFADIAGETITGTAALLKDSQSSLSRFFGWLNDAGVTIVTGFQWVGENSDKIWSRMLLSIESVFISIKDSATQIFTNDLPKIFDFFIKQMDTAIELEIANAKRFGSAFASAITGDFKGAQQQLVEAQQAKQKAAEDMLKDFENLDIGKRNKTDRELQIDKDIKNLDKSMSNFGDRFLENKKAFEDMFKSDKNKLEVDLSSNASKFFGDLSAAEAEKKHKANDLHGEDVNRNMLDKDSRAGTFEGIEDLNKRIQSAAASSEDRQLKAAGKVEDAAVEIHEAANIFGDGALTLENALEHLDAFIDEGLGGVLDDINMMAGLAGAQDASDKANEDAFNAMNEDMLLLNKKVDNNQVDAAAEADNRLMIEQNKLLADSKDLLKDLGAASIEQADAVSLLGDGLANIGALYYPCLA